MTLTINNSVLLRSGSTSNNHHHRSPPPPPPSSLTPFLFISTRRHATHIVSATGKYSKNKRSNNKLSTTTTKEEYKPTSKTMEFDGDDVDEIIDFAAEEKAKVYVASLPGEKTDFWEGSKWDALGFFVQYMWAFGILFALVACGIAVATYNEGATDFRETPAYKESVQSRDILEEPEASDSDVFESNPTEEAPALE